MRLMSLFLTTVTVFCFCVFSTPANAASCKKCPTGCVAEQLVAALETDEESFAFDSCPTGCVSVSNVMFFHDKSVCDEPVKAVPKAAPAPVVVPVVAVPVAPAPVETAPVEPAPVEPAPVEPAPVASAPVEPVPVEPVPVAPAPVETAPVETAPVETVDTEKQADELPAIDNSHSTDHRIVASQTAYGLKKGKFVATAYGIRFLFLGYGFLELQYGITDFIQLGLVATGPTGNFGVMPTIRFHTEINDYMAISGGMFFGYNKFYGDFIFSRLQQLLFGTSMEATFKIRGKHFFNLSLMVAGAGIKVPYDYDNDGWDLINGVLMYPAIGYRGVFHKNWSFQLELGFPMYVKKAESNEYSESDGGVDDLIITIFYGVRGHGEIIFGELGFMVVVSDMLSEVQNDYPLGFPYISVGAAF